MSPVVIGKLSVSSICLKADIAGLPNKDDKVGTCHNSPQWLQAVPDRNDAKLLYISYTEDAEWGSNAAQGAVHAVKVNRNGASFTPGGDVRIGGFVKQGGIDLNADGSKLGMLCAKSVPEWAGLPAFNRPHKAGDSNSCLDFHETSKCWNFGNYEKLPLALSFCEVDTKAMTETSKSRWMVSRQYLSGDRKGTLGTFPVRAGKDFAADGFLTYNVKHKTWSMWWNANSIHHTGSSYWSFTEEAEEVLDDNSFCQPEKAKDKTCVNPPGLKQRRGPRGPTHDWNACGGHEKGAATTYNPTTGETAMFCHAGARSPNVFMSGFVYKNEWNTNKDGPSWGDGQDKGKVKGLSTYVTPLAREGKPNGAGWEGGIRPCGEGFIVAFAGVRWRGEEGAKGTKPIPIPADRLDDNFRINSENIWEYPGRISIQRNKNKCKNKKDPVACAYKGPADGQDGRTVVENLFKKDGVYAMCQVMDGAGKVITKKIVSKSDTMTDDGKTRKINFQSVKIATLGSDPAQGKCERFLMGWSESGGNRWLVEIDGNCNRLTEPLEVAKYSYWPDAAGGNWFTYKDGAVGWVNSWQRDDREVECADGTKKAVQQGTSKKCKYGGKECNGQPDHSGSKCRAYAKTSGYVTNEAFITTYKP